MWDVRIEVNQVSTVRKEGTVLDVDLGYSPCTMGTPASRATLRAIKVFPHPGGPVNNTASGSGVLSPSRRVAWSTWRYTSWCRNASRTDVSIALFCA